MRILITGAAGFIGFHLLRRLSKVPGLQLTGLDNLNTYYDLRLKHSRLRACGIDVAQLQPMHPQPSVLWPSYTFVKADVSDYAQLQTLFAQGDFDLVVHLAAQAGVRYSITNALEYGTANLQGFLNVLECCRHHQVRGLLYASSSSVYGEGAAVPFREEGPMGQLSSLYAATKRSNELMAETYSRLYGLTTVGARFFTVYGPYGRPDMAPMLFAEAICKGEPIRVFNHGQLRRDFTYVVDVAEALWRLLRQMGAGKVEQGSALLLNVGRGEPVALMDFISLMEENLGIPARKELLPMQPGDVSETWADTSRLQSLTGYAPRVSLAQGIRSFVHWYKHDYLPLLKEQGVRA